MQFDIERRIDYDFRDNAMSNVFQTKKSRTMTIFSISLCVLERFFSHIDKSRGFNVIQCLISSSVFIDLLM